MPQNKSCPPVEKHTYNTISCLDLLVGYKCSQNKMLLSCSGGSKYKITYVCPLPSQASGWFMYVMLSMCGSPMVCNHFHKRFSVCYWLCAPVPSMAELCRVNHHRFNCLCKVAEQEPVAVISAF